MEPLPLDYSRESGLSRYAWVVVGLLWPVALFNYLDRQLLASMKFSVMGEIPTVGSEANWGIMLGQFKWVYAVLSPIGGYLADRFSRRMTIFASLFVWSAVTWTTGHVTTYKELLWTRTLMGISEAFYIPAALALIADFHSARTRSRAVGIHQMAIYCGVILGGFGGYVADAPMLGWRFAFDVTGIAGMIYAMPLLLLLRDAPRGVSADVDENLQGPSLAGLGELLRNGSFILLVLCFTLPAVPRWVVLDWMPSILKKRFDIGQGVAGVSAAFYFNVASIFGAIAGGWLADRWVRSGERRGRIFVSAAGLALLVPALLGVGTLPTLLAVIGYLTLFGFGWGCFDCNNMPILSQIVRPRLRATGYGLMNLVSISCGGVADGVYGKLSDHHVSDRMIFGVFAVVSGLSVGLMLWIGARVGREAKTE